MDAVAEMPAPMSFSDSAANKVKQLIDEEGNPELKLRVFVTGGGCSGFQYGFTFDDKKDDDNAWMQDGVSVVVDPQSAMYLKDATVNYVEDFRGAGLRLRAFLGIVVDQDQGIHA